MKKGLRKAKLQPKLESYKNNKKHVRLKSKSQSVKRSTSVNKKERSLSTKV